MQKIKILLVENELAPFEEMYETMNSKLGHFADIYPKMEEIDNPDGYLYFIEECVEKLDFERILTHYPDIDVFVIDVYLRESDDNDNGFNLAKQINEGYNGKSPKIIFTSNAKYTRDMYIWKGESNFANRIVDKIIYVFKDRFVESEEVVVAPTVAETGKPYAANNIGSRQKVKQNIKRHGYLDTGYRGIYWMGDKLKRGIHMVITLIFFGLILITALYAAKKIYSDFNPLDTKPGVENISTQTNPQQSAPVIAEHMNKEETLILKNAEHIFLYLLPIFIVFGFYIYYKTNTSISFLGGNIVKDDQENSTRSMNLTKIIFISSIISYTLIKMIDKIFFEKDVSLVTLIASGILLIVLIAYLILISRKGH